MSLDSFVDLPENIISETTGNGLLLRNSQISDCHRSV